MKIPKRLKIGGHTYNVEMVDRVETDPGEDNLGDCEWKLNRIRIKKGLPHTQTEETFFHEAIHALWTDKKEDEVNQMAFKIYAFLKDNNLLR